MPIEISNTWQIRPFSGEELEVYKTYYIICEGENSEYYYFYALLDYLKKQRISNNFEICLLKKTGNEKSYSNPKKLLELGHDKVINEHESFDTALDKIIFVFDVDIYKNDKKTFNNLLNMKAQTDIFAVTNPCFELFLLLHKKNIFNEFIKGNKKQILENKKISKNRRYLAKLVSSKLGINSKKRTSVSKLAKEIETAIREEKYLNQEVNYCLNRLTCNIGKVFSQIISDDIHPNKYD